MIIFLPFSPYFELPQSLLLDLPPHCVQIQPKDLSRRQSNIILYTRHADPECDERNTSITRCGKQVLIVHNLSEERFVGHVSKNQYNPDQSIVAVRWGRGTSCLPEISCSSVSTSPASPAAPVTKTICLLMPRVNGVKSTVRNILKQGNQCLYDDVMIKHKKWRSNLASKMTRLDSIKT